MPTGHDPDQDRRAVARRTMGTPAANGGRSLIRTARLGAAEYACGASRRTSLRGVAGAPPVPGVTFRAVTAVSLSSATSCQLHGTPGALSQRRSRLLMLAATLPAGPAPTW